MPRNKPGHYSVAPRYSCGSPAQVSYEIAERVSRDERRAFAIAKQGVYGAAKKREAELLGLGGIVEYRSEARLGWFVQDLITGAHFERFEVEAGYSAHNKLVVTVRHAHQQIRKLDPRVREKLAQALRMVSENRGTFRVEIPHRTEADREPRVTAL